MARLVMSGSPVYPLIHQDFRVCHPRLTRRHDAAITLNHHGPFEGDRGDVAAVGAWCKGWWRLEVRRELETGSRFDVAIADGTYLWVAVFDHTQTRHSQHLHPVRLEWR